MPPKVDMDRRSRHVPSTTYQIHKSRTPTGRTLNWETLGANFISEREHDAPSESEFLCDCDVRARRARAR